VFGHKSDSQSCDIDRRPDRSQNRRCELHGVVIEGIGDFLIMATVLPA